MLVDANSVTLYSCLFFGYKGGRGVFFCVFQCKVILIRKDQGFSSYLTFPSESTFFFFLRGGKKGLVFQEKNLSAQS